MFAICNCHQTCESVRQTECMALHIRARHGAVHCHPVKQAAGALRGRALRPHAYTARCRLARRSTLHVSAAALQAKGDRFYAEDLRVKNALGEGEDCSMPAHAWRADIAAMLWLCSKSPIFSPQEAMARSLRCAPVPNALGNARSFRLQRLHLAPSCTADVKNLQYTA